MNIQLNSILLYRNGNIDVCIKSKGEMEKFKMQLPASIRKGDLFFQISIEPGENQYYNWLYNNNIQLIAYEDQYKNLLVDYYNKPRKITGRIYRIICLKCPHTKIII